MARAPIRIVAEPPERSILVTGGAGFVRAALCRLLAEDAAVRVINLAPGATPGAPIEFDNYWDVHGDPADSDLLRALLGEARIDAVIRLAPPEEAAAADEQAYVGMYRLIDATLDHWRRLSGDERARFRFLEVSDDAIFGGLSAGAGRFAATSPYRPSSPAGAVAAAAALLARSWQVQAGLPVVHAVHGSLYGPGQDADAFVPRTILSAAAGDPVEIAGTGAETRDWLYIDDAVCALRDLLPGGRPGASYPLGARVERSRIAMAAMICDLLDRLDPRPDGRRRRSLVRFTADRADPDHRRALDPDEIERDLGWKAAMPLRDGLLATIDSYLSAGVPHPASLNAASA